MYNNKEELLNLIKKEKLWAKKHLGQNFLINKKIIETIIKAANLNKEDLIIEVGPGLGILTKELLNKGGHIRSIELDRELIPYIKKTFKDKHFELEEGTALKATLPQTKYKLVANIPYYITSPLLRHFLNPQTKQEKRPTLIVLLVQKEVAEKICAKPGDHSVLSLQTQIFGHPSIIKTVSPKNFHPAPKVDSAILKIEVYKKSLIKNLKLFSRITRIAFHQRRKTLKNTIKNYLNINGEKTDTIFKKINIDSSRRPQTLSIEEWQKLMTIIEETT